MPGLRSLTYFYTHQSSFLRELIRPWTLQYNQLSGCVCCMTAVMTACLCQGVYVAIRVNSMCIVSACGCLQYCGVYSRLWMCKYKECVCVCVSQLCHSFPVKYRAISLLSTQVLTEQAAFQWQCLLVTLCFYFQSSTLEHLRTGRHLKFKAFYSNYTDRIATFMDFTS